VRRHVTGRLGRGSLGYRIFGLDARMVQHGVPCHDTVLSVFSKKKKENKMENSP
jgi:hypothetical protein